MRFLFPINIAVLLGLFLFAPLPLRAEVDNDLSEALKDFLISKKERNQGTLNYLKSYLEEKGIEWELGSSYTLTLYQNEGVDSSDVKQGYLLRYDVVPSSIFYDKITGTVKTGLSGDDLAAYFIEVPLKDINAELYTFDFNRMRYGPEEGILDGDPHEKLVNYVIDTEKFYHTIPDKEHENKPLKNPTIGTVEGVFYEIKGEGNWNGKSRALMNISGNPIVAIKADFFDNMSGSGTDGKGGAVVNGTLSTPSEIGSIEGNFMNNEATMEGGAVWNYMSKIGKIQGDFIYNHVVNPEKVGMLRGGAILNAGEASIGEIYGYYIGNYVEGRDQSDSTNGNVGGAIYNADGGKIDLIAADFIGNAVLLHVGNVDVGGHGGALYNGGGDSNKYKKTEVIDSSQNARKVVSYIGTIIGDFYGNRVDMLDFDDTAVIPEDKKNLSWGGAIANQAVKDKALGYAGGAMIERIVGGFVRNYVRGINSSGGGAIYNNRGSYIRSIEANFVRNYAKVLGESADIVAGGGAIYNYYKEVNQNLGDTSRIDFIDGNFYGNYAEAVRGNALAYGGAIANCEGSEIDTINGDFIGNYAKTKNNTVRGGAIYSELGSSINEISGNFYNNYVESEKGIARGGAISNGGDIGAIVNAVFSGNYAANQVAREEGKSGNYARGGAIYNEKTLSIVAEDNGVSFFRNNFVRQLDDKGKVKWEENEAIYAQKNSVLTLTAQTGGSIIFEDKINGDDEGFTMNLTGERVDKKTDTSGNKERDTTGAVFFHNLVRNADVGLDDVTLHLGIATGSMGSGYLTDRENYQQSDVFRSTLLEARSGTVLLQDGTITEYLLGTLKAYGYGWNFKDKGEDREDNRGGIKKADYDENRYATFTLDIYLQDKQRAISDVITTFGVVDDEAGAVQNGEVKWAKVRTGVIRAGMDQVSEGRITLSSFAFDTEDETDPENVYRVQVLNFTVMDQKENHEVSEEFYKNFKDSAPIELDDQFATTKYARAQMLSSTVLCKSIELDTTDTHNDSLKITNWRDNLAAWAEIREGDKDVDGNDQWVDEKDKNVTEKIFTIVQGLHPLTRNVKDKEGKVLGGVQGNTWTLRGVNQYYSILNLKKHNLLETVGEEQTGRLERFTLRNAPEQGISNKGSLTLDTMNVEKELRIVNDNQLTVNGIMDINNSISATKEGKMTIDDESHVTEGQTIVNITGSIRGQDITHKGKLVDETYSTVTTLETTDYNGTPTAAFKNFTNAGNSLRMEGGLFRLGDMGMNRLVLKDLDVKDGLIHVASSTVDLARRTMGGIEVRGKATYDPTNALTTVAAGDGAVVPGNIRLDRIIITADSTRKVINVPFVPTQVGAAVEWDAAAWERKTVPGTIWEYEVLYNKEDNPTYGAKSGEFTFICSGDPVPEVQAGAVTELAGSYVTMMQIYDYSFEHADLYASSLYSARKERLYAGRYTVVNATKGKDGKGSISKPDAASCAATTAGLHGGLWLRTYSSSEHMPLRHGAKVSANLYGGLVGGDSDLKEHSNGWASVLSIYGGYLGSSQKYEGVRIKQNGGAFGLTGTFYRKNFFTAVTASVGMATADTTTRFGHDDFDIMMGGIASRTGYNIELGSGLYVLQPTLQVAYTCFNVQDYTNAAGVKMDTELTHSVQIHPFIKLIRNTDCTWKPYVTAGFVYDALGKTKFKANGMELPSLSIKPYVEYSVGAQRTWKDRYTLYGQVTGRNGGREGVEGSLGLRCVF